MAVFTEEAARANVRNRDGRRVFYLASGDHLTPSAREWLRQERIELLPAAEAASQPDKDLDGGTFSQKPEHMTHLRSGLLVRKDHPRILLRGKLDSLEAELLLTAKRAQERGKPKLAHDLQEVLRLVRQILRCDVLDEPLELSAICGLTPEQLREQSHRPQKYFDQPHFMPEPNDSQLLLWLNRLRTQLREAELALYTAFQDREGLPTRPDLLLALNRLSSLLWIWMLQMKKEDANG